MTTPLPADPLIHTMRMLGRTVRLLFSCQEPERARSLAMELARATSPCKGLDDPVRSWEANLQVDRGLGRARRLQRLVNSPVWQSDHGTPGSGKTPTESAADYLFASVMNLVHQMPLCDEAHVFRLWYLATRAATPPENALRLFGDLRCLPAHQQLAAGARLLETLGSDALHATPSRPRLQPAHPVEIPRTTRRRQRLRAIRVSLEGAAQGLDL
ncbi:hypothetical protein [Hydrogenophaga sp. ANAO-22]|uniref:hypothetical protein n=1 Tax=Hydrogenophaga sp. ANAO-22 TaxID=3166645 RepID=UPI0036D299E8